MAVLIALSAPVLAFSPTPQVNQLDNPDQVVFPLIHSGQATDVMQFSIPFTLKEGQEVDDIVVRLNPSWPQSGSMPTVIRKYYDAESQTIRIEVLAGSGGGAGNHELVGSVSVVIIDTIVDATEPNPPHEGLGFPSLQQGLVPGCKPVATLPR